MRTIVHTIVGFIICFVCFGFGFAFGKSYHREPSSIQPSKDDRYAIIQSAYERGLKQAVRDCASIPLEQRLFITLPTNGTVLIRTNATEWQYDAARALNKSIEDKAKEDNARFASPPPEGMNWVRTWEYRMPFDWKMASPFELGFKEDGTVTWRKTPELLSETNKNANAKP